MMAVAFNRLFILASYNHVAHDVTLFASKHQGAISSMADKCTILRIDSVFV